MRVDHRTLICFDLELCCWEDRRPLGEIIAVGAVKLDLATGVIEDRIHYLVQPEIDEVSEFCTQLTGITADMLRKQGRPLTSVLDSLRQRMGGHHKVYASWGNDAEVLAQECQRKAIESPINQSLNIASLYMLRLRHQGHRLGLQKAMRKSGLEFQGTAHNALVDSENLARLITHMNLV